MDTALRIGANFEAGQGASEKVINPRTGKTIVEISEASDAQVDSAVAAASEAFESWSRTTRYLIRERLLAPNYGAPQAR